MNPIPIIRDAADKLRILFWMLCEQVRVWHTEVWPKDLDEPYCCDGRDCFCGGMSIRDGWTHE